MTNHNHKLNDFLNSISNLQDQLLLCKPSDPIQFVSQYFENGNGSSINDTKSLYQCIPYLMKQTNIFRDKLCEIYCEYIKEQQTNGIISIKSTFEVLKNFRLKNRWNICSTLDEVDSYCYTDYDLLLTTFFCCSESRTLGARESY